eukprot:COSAG01_NODE_57816_length_309_cov_221.328571_1_plen_59_part_10
MRIRPEPDGPSCTKGKLGEGVLSKELPYVSSVVAIAPTVTQAAAATTTTTNKCNNTSSA